MTLDEIIIDEAAYYDTQAERAALAAAAARKAGVSLTFATARLDVLYPPGAWAKDVII